MDTDLKLCIITVLICGFGLFGVWWYSDEFPIELLLLVLGVGLLNGFIISLTQRRRY